MAICERPIWRELGCNWHQTQVLLLNSHMSRQKEELAWLDHVLSGCFVQKLHTTQEYQRQGLQCLLQRQFAGQDCVSIPIEVPLAPNTVRSSEMQGSDVTFQSSCCMQTAYLSSFGKRKRCRQSLLCGNKARSFSLPSQRAFGIKNCVSRKRETSWHCSSLQQRPASPAIFMC